MKRKPGNPEPATVKPGLRRAVPPAPRAAEPYHPTCEVCDHAVTDEPLYRTTTGAGLTWVGHRSCTEEAARKTTGQA